MVEYEGAAVRHRKDPETLIAVPGDWQDTLALVHDCSGLEGHGHQQATLASVGRVQTYLEGEGLWAGDHDYYQQDEASPA